METFAAVTLITSALFLAMILELAATPKFAGRMARIFLVIAAVSGLLIYSYGYTADPADGVAVDAIRSLLAVCGMLVAKMDFALVQDLPPFDREWGKVLFWVVHWCALYATASAAITTVGAEALRKLRLYLARWGKLEIVYGVNADSVAFGTELAAGRRTPVVFVDSGASPAFTGEIARAGCVLRTDGAALAADPAFAKSLGVRGGKRKITLYALSKDPGENLRRAKAFLEAAKKLGAQPRQLSLVILGQENGDISGLQVLGDRYGYGYVTVFSEAALAARLLVRTYPPCNTVSFDEQGAAQEDFEALIAGFGRTGQEVLRQLVMNGQFAGSRFRAAVFAPDCGAVKGYFAKCCGQVLEQYDIRFYPCDARSEQMYDYILERGGKLKYLVLCTGSEDMNREIAQELEDFLDRQGMELPIYQCTARGIRYSRGNITQEQKLYRPEVLSMEELDRMAMVINHRYQPEPRGSALEAWMKCDYFSRMSCRASADFSPAMLRAAHKTAEQVLEEGWDLTPEQQENLSRTEHLRWCAYHYCMGFAPMSQEEYDSRERLYLQDRSIRVGKNMRKRTHACLRPWEELDALSERESRITGKHVDYKASDMKNVMAMPELLRQSRQAEWGDLDAAL